MARRDPRAVGMEKVFKYVVRHGPVPRDHPLGNIKLMQVVIETYCPGLTASAVEPEAYWDERCSDYDRSHLLLRCLETAILFDFGRLAAASRSTDQLQGAIILAFRGHLGQGAEGCEATVEPMKACQTGITEAFIKSLCTFFDEQINQKLPRQNMIAQPARLSAASFRYSTTTLTEYQDAELVSLYQRFRDVAVKLGLPFPDEISAPKVSRRGRKTDDDQSLSIPEVTEQSGVRSPVVTDDERVLAMLRDFGARSTRSLPPAFHPPALESLMPPYYIPPPPPLRLLRDEPNNIILPADQFVVPSIRKVACSEAGIAFLDEQEYALDDLFALPHSILIGGPGSGKSSLLRHLAYTVNTRVPADNGLAAMFLVDAADYIKLGGSQPLPGWVAQQLQASGCLSDMGVRDLESCLERLNKSGRLCWGLDQTAHLTEAAIQTICLQVKQSAKCIVVFGTLTRPLLRAAEIMLGNLNNLFQIQPFDAGQIQRYCAIYAELADAHSVPALLRMAESHPDLASSPLGLACICATDNNSLRLYSPVHVYMAEMFCRGGLEPDSSLVTGGRPKSPGMRMLRDVAAGYWRTRKTPEVFSPMSEDEVIEWSFGAAARDEAKKVLQSVERTRLIVRSYVGDALQFALPAVYHLLLAANCLEAKERAGQGVQPIEVARMFSAELPPSVVKMIQDLTFWRWHAWGLDGAG